MVSIEANMENPRPWEDPVLNRVLKKDLQRLVGSLYGRRGLVLSVHRKEQLANPDHSCPSPMAADLENSLLILAWQTLVCREVCYGALRMVDTRCWRPLNCEVENRGAWTDRRLLRLPGNRPVHEHPSLLLQPPRQLLARPASPSPTALQVPDFDHRRRLLVEDLALAQEADWRD